MTDKLTEALLAITDAHEALVRDQFEGTQLLDGKLAVVWVARQALSSPTPSDKPAMHELALLRIPNTAIYFVIRNEYGSGRDQDHSRYFYEEHSCPTNWFAPVAVIDDGDADPHGFVEFVRSVDIASDVEFDSDNVAEIFPEVEARGQSRQGGGVDETKSISKNGILNAEAFLATFERCPECNDIISDAVRYPTKCPTCYKRMNPPYIPPTKADNGILKCIRQMDEALERINNGAKFNVQEVNDARALAKKFLKGDDNA